MHSGFSVTVLSTDSCLFYAGCSLQGLPMTVSGSSPPLTKEESFSHSGETPSKHDTLSILALPDSAQQCTASRGWTRVHPLGRPCQLWSSVCSTDKSPRRMALIGTSLPTEVLTGGSVPADAALTLSAAGHGECRVRLAVEC